MSKPNDWYSSEEKKYMDREFSKAEMVYNKNKELIEEMIKKKKAEEDQDMKAIEKLKELLEKNYQEYEEKLEEMKNKEQQIFEQIAKNNNDDTTSPLYADINDGVLTFTNKTWWGGKKRQRKSKRKRRKSKKRKSKKRKRKSKKRKRKRRTKRR